ncbi:HEPN/Toprim-associated domain-containing protein [Paenibacillus borealis]|uniref:HEPN/Toprim N-terminal domain-containing protein n=1 Tax=Paenibacillus borealis TaxID=160799 RepID=A0A089MGF4_PAEBO|nr:HEPN/Toprim-associated domain-containing protein [Paenibacillus borealis]AIQ55694.1 hypothetical protein PBOR_00950 [Paenibacillus borealis]
MTTFRESDKQQYNYLDEDNEMRNVAKYSNRVEIIKLRLDIMGFNLESTKKEFLLNNNEHYSIEQIGIDGEWEQVLIEGYTFDNWMTEMKWIIKSGQYSFELIKNIESNDKPVLYNMLYEQENGDSLYGFECSDIRYIFRAIIELFEDTDEFYLDYSDLVDGGYCSEEDKICELSLRSLADNYAANEKTIIITEGSSDIAIIKRSLGVLYPDVIDYYSFMDFEHSNAQGSASSLAGYVKAFIGSGLRTRVIALFDNDTAAQEAIITLNKIKVPSNIKVLTYPYLKYVEEYPTIGPHGIAFMNINGLAGSIELYLGRDILTNTGQEYPTKYMPVQWKGYSKALKKYQGEILNKEIILKTYFSFLDQLSITDEIKIDHDWDGMELIMQTIFRAFD